MKTIIAKIQTKTNLTEQEAWWMLEHITNSARAALLHASASSLTKQELQAIDNWIDKLSQDSIPLSYLLGSVPFLNLTIKVTPPILIPRPETEEWVAGLIQELQPYRQRITSILEIGTGSGCIALALAKAFPNTLVIAIDINPTALKLAQINATLNMITNVSFVTSDLFHNIPNKTFDLIVSNPPYIDPIHKDTMMPQVTQWEDERALFAQDNGLYLITKIIKKAQENLNFHAYLPYQLVLEHDADQQERIKEIAQKNGFNCYAKKDLFGNWRTSWCQLIN